MWSRKVRGQKRLRGSAAPSTQSLGTTIYSSLRHSASRQLSRSMCSHVCACMYLGRRPLLTCIETEARRRRHRGRRPLLTCMETEARVACIETEARQKRHVSRHKHVWRHKRQQHLCRLLACMPAARTYAGCSISLHVWRLLAWACSSLHSPRSILLAPCSSLHSPPNSLPPVSKPVS